MLMLVLSTFPLSTRGSRGGGGDHTQGHANLKTQVDPRSTPPPCVPNLDVCYHPNQKLSVYGSRNQTNNHKSEEPMTKLEERCHRRAEE